ncbi:MAG: cadherin domain-containing protein [Bacteroidales bacterium]|nr:cadherin domain-containing protein [Bacteroidales bacterium]
METLKITSAILNKNRTKALILFLVFLFYTNVINAQKTEISAGDVSGIWEYTGSPYNINGEITIQNATTLTIEPGVIVEFQGHYKLIVEGQLLAVGTETDTIEFTINDTTGFAQYPDSIIGGWHGIRFANNTSVDSSKIVYCKLQYGKATDGDDGTTNEDDKGGGIYVKDFSKLRIENCLIDNNYAYYGGGIIADSTTELSIKNNIISNNNAYYGGGISCIGSNYVLANATIVNNTIKSNEASRCGGGIYSYRSQQSIIGNEIDENLAGWGGGGLYICHYAYGSIEKNKIRNNEATGDGGGIVFYTIWDFDFNTNLISNNHSESAGGIYVYSTNPHLKSINNTIVNNSVQGIYNNGTIINTNSIIYGNGSSFGGSTTNITATYCNIEGGYTGTGNIDVDPEFTNPSSGIGIQEDALTADWSLPPASLAANAGTPDTTGLDLPETDIAGKERVYGGAIDMGAYELNQTIERSDTITVNTTWNADTINITGDIIINNGITLTITEGNVINFMGHYKIDVQGTILAVGTETDTVVFTYNDTTGFSNTAIIDGGWLGIKFDNTPATNDSSKFVYCKIEYGKANIGTTIADSCGGAFYVNNYSKLLIENSLIKDNYGYYGGGAIYLLESSPIIKNSIFNNNQTSGSGGALFLSKSSPKIKNNIMAENEAFMAGAIECYDNSNPEISANLISNNNGGIYGGGIYVHANSNPVLTNNIICNNWAQYCGGIYIAENSNPSIINNTIVNNNTDENGGGVYCTQNSSPVFRNNIIYGNTATVGNQVYIYGDDSDPDFIYCDIEEGLSSFGLEGGAIYEGLYENNYVYNPLFEAPSGGAGINFDGVNADWSLHVSSSCLNAGDTNQTGIPTEDFEGNSRVYNGIIDIGAHELQEAKTICGPWFEDSYWAGDTIKVVCETIIDPGFTVIINPGTVIEFTDYYKLIVEGVMLAEGTKTDSITFTTNDIATGWHGIRFDGNTSTDTSKFAYCKFENGKATGAGYEATGGAIYSNAFDLILIGNSSFFNNSSSGGGAIYLRAGASPVIKNCRFINNESLGSTFGGAITVEGGSTAKIINNLFANNIAGDGGAVGLFSAIEFVNNSVVNNSATTNGGGIYISGTNTSTFKNCIFYGNSGINGNQIYLRDDDTDPDFANCDIEGGSAAFYVYTGSYTGTLTNCIDSDPQFTNPSSGVGNQADAFSSVWTLKDVSPCINTGTADTTGLNLPLVDIIGIPRVINDIIDMGAYESLVTFECGNISSNTTWDADTVKISCDITIDDTYTLTIVPGTYVEFQGHYKIIVNGRILAEGTPTDSIIFTMNDTTGFADTSIVDGGWAGIWFDETQTNNDTTKFAFCKFQFGKAWSASVVVDRQGGAMNVNLVSKLTITNSLFINNMATGEYAGGGAVCIKNTSAPVISNCTFIENQVNAYYNGGGGAIFIDNSNPEIYNSRFFNNVTDSSSGGGIYCIDNSSPRILNSLFTNNYARYGGALLLAVNVSPTMYNNTIVYNNSKIGGGISLYENCNPLLKNNILYANTDSAGGAQVYIYDNASQPDFSYNNIHGDSAGFDMPDTVTYTGNYLNNIDENPLFINPTIGAGIEYDGTIADWTLQGDNPCINTGTSDTTGMNIPQLDLAQNLRIYNDIRIDIGAYEYQNNPPEINTQSFNVDENSPNSTVVATATASDIDGNENSFSITGGNTNGAFAISSSGQITVANTDELDYETVPGQKFDLIVQVQDNGIGNLTDTTIITININDVNDAPVINPFSFDIDENSLNSSVVGTVSGTDEDSPAQNLTYSIVGGTYASNFGINESTGEITVTDSTPLNFETNPVITITVQIQDDGTGNLTNNSTITINLNDVNDYPVISNQAFAIWEHSAVSFLVGTVAASDEDLPAQNLIFSIIAGNEDEAFAINNSTGELTVNNSDSVDYEIEQSKIITVQVVDDGTGTLSNQAEITVNLSNINDNAPIFNDTIVNVDENVNEGTLIVSLIATDADNLTGLSYSIVSGDDNEIFHLQNGNGHNLYLTKYDSINYELYQQFELVISVTDGDSIREANVTINVNDLNEYPVIETHYFNIDELSSNGTVAGTITATDPDIGQSLYYYIAYGNHYDVFVLDSVTGILTVSDSTQLNYEGSYPSYSLQVEVIDNGEPQLYTWNYIYIAVNDVNEPPVVENQTFFVNENSYPNTIVGGVSYTHDDQGQAVTFSISNGNEDNVFNINENTGEITVAIRDSLDYETNPTFEFVVEVTDNFSPAMSDTATITINLYNVNEPPVIDDYTFTIDENSPYETLVGTVTAIDPENISIIYYFDTENLYPPFTINSTGEITVIEADSIDYEYRTQFALTVVARDNEYLTSSATVTINLNDINEVPVINYNYYYIEENNPVNTIVCAVDFVTDEGETLNFSITSGNYYDVFGIDSISGEIFVDSAEVLNYELHNYFDLTISATDNSPENLTGEGIITICVINANDAPVINSQTFYYLKDPYGDTYVGRITASDEDGSQIYYYIESGNINNAFILDYLGDLRVAIPSEINVDVTPTYNLIVRAEDYELSDTAVVTVSLVPDAIAQFNLNELLNIYPNPAKDYLYLDMKNIVKEINIRIFDVKNQIIYENTFTGNSKDNIEKVDISEYQKGLYFIRAFYNNKEYTGRIVLQ